MVSSFDCFEMYSADNENEDVSESLRKASASLSKSVLDLCNYFNHKEPAGLKSNLLDLHKAWKSQQEVFPRNELQDALHTRRSSRCHIKKTLPKFSHVFFTYFNPTDSSISKPYGELSYIGQDFHKIPPILAEYYGSKVNCLDVSFNCLTTLQGIEKFSNLQELILDNNTLSDGLMIPKMQQLHTLSINKNNISHLELFLQKIKDSLPSLRYLSLLGNKACPNQLSDASKDEEDYIRYRYYVINQLPNLQFLDSTPVTKHEREEAARRGHLMKVAKPLNNSSQSDGGYQQSSPSKFTPLPMSGRSMGDHQGAYGKCRYRYSGKHSEGNRFIQNQDL